MKTFPPTAALLAAALLTAAPAAVAQGAMERGAALAAELCTQCHATGLPGPQTDIAEPFHSIVTYRSDDYIRGFLANPHARDLMPPYLLSEEERDDLVAFMRTLRPRPQGR